MTHVHISSDSIKLDCIPVGTVHLHYIMPNDFILYNFLLPRPTPPPPPNFGDNFNGKVYIGRNYEREVLETMI